MWKLMLLTLALLGALAPELPGADRKKQEIKPLDRIIREAELQANPSVKSPGSLYDSAGRFGDLSRDLRAAQVNDLVTVVIYDNLSAVSKGATAASRKSEARASIGALGGPMRVNGPLSALVDMSGEGKLDGQGETSRETTMKTTLTARVTHVLPNGNMVVEGSKEVMVNSEKQRVTIRGLLRWNDLTSTNRVSSDRLAELEVRVDGKGVVNDAIRRPGFLYRFLLGLLPF